MKIGLTILSALALAGSIAAASGRSLWEKVPAKDHARTSPLAGDPKAIPAGAALYMHHCAQCHGNDGMGVGKKKPPVRSEKVRNATDGDLEWFLRQGDLAHGMPSFSSLPQAQRWQIVAYLRFISPST